MASPRIFISSTCYDLAEERDGLSDFCENFGFDVTLSERGDVFYHPDLHTHHSCVKETSTCQMLILIIGGRFGGSYKVDPTKSITNAEYAAAIDNGSPTFTFVKQDVLNDHNVWQRNKTKPFSKEIIYPSIEKQEYAEEIFKFIDTVRLASVNNGFFGFRLTKDIHGILRKQWAGMMFEFLQNRGITKQMNLTNASLGNLSVVSTKIEELVKQIYRNIDTVGAANAIKEIENESLAESFLNELANLFEDPKFILAERLNDGQLPTNWWDFARKFSYATLIETEFDKGRKVVSLYDGFQHKRLVKISGDISSRDENRMAALSSEYEVFKSIPVEVRKKIMDKYTYRPTDILDDFENLNEAKVLPPAGKRKK